MPWQPERVEAWLRLWAQDALASWAEAGRWPLHAGDREDFGDPAPAELSSLYCGGLGVWLALAKLAAVGFCELPESPAAISRQLLKNYQAAPDTGECVPSWFLGQSSLLTAACLAEPDAGLADQLEALMRANRENPTREALWGAPGTLLGALSLWEQTGESRWRATFLDSVEAIWSAWQQDPDSGLWLWEQDMYGQQTRYLGAGHGWAGNLYPLWRGYALLDPDRQAALRMRSLDGLRSLALESKLGVNWPPLPGSDRMLLQWCHGAPGMITSLRFASLPEALPLLQRAGQLIVAAGPLRKGVSLCHGTAGNGAALLTLWQLSGESEWLSQARHFGMFALDQAHKAYQTQGHWRYSLWTGDAGL
ncbi:MAG: hypothetical protein CVV27_07805, partial [Candidatus Melainabacteria bacterium HGW-Melainabacteria-1]